MNETSSASTSVPPDTSVPPSTSSATNSRPPPLMPLGTGTGGSTGGGHCLPDAPAPEQGAHAA